MLIPVLSHSLLSTVLLALGTGDVHVDSKHGFEIELPDGWRPHEQDGGDQGFVLTLVPAGSAGQEGVSVTVRELPEVTSADTMLELSRASVQSGDQFSEYEEWQDQLGGRDAPALRVVFHGPQGDFRIIQSFVFEDGRAYTIQRHGPVDEFETHAELYETVVDTFSLVDVVRDESEEHLQELIALCGDEVEWAENWEDAAERARAEDKMVVVVAFLVTGFSISSTPRTTTFVNEDVVALVNERFVPLWYSKGMQAPFTSSYGLSGSTFGQALLVTSPEGEVLLETHEASSPDVAYPFLRACVARHPEYGGVPVPEDLPDVERATRLVARGEFDRAREVLGADTSGRAHRLRAQMLALERRGAQALEALAAAAAAGGEPEDALLVEEAECRARGGDTVRAAELLERVLSEFPESEFAPAATYMLGLLDLAAGNTDGARARWEALVAAPEASRWSWQAAATLSSPVLTMEIRPDLGWPNEPVIQELLRFPESGSIPDERVAEAEREALTRLLETQRPDGSWWVPSQTSNPVGMGASPFGDSIAALGGRALLRHLDFDGARAAATRAAEFVRNSVASRVEHPPVVLYMDYMTWSDSMMLHFLAEASDAGLVERETAAPTIAALVDDLASRQVPGDGWSYYVTGDLEGSAAPAQSISFTTAAAVLALCRVRAAGFDVPDEVLEPAVSALERMRGDDGAFTYFLYHGQERGRPSGGRPGAVGRGPVCELALFQAGVSDEERLAESIDHFLEHAHLFAAQQGKVLMHAGPDGQGCHYLLFDYAHAALAQAELVGDRRVEALVRELVLDCRQPDGMFLDTPLIGRAYGTAMALIGLAAIPARE